MFVLIISIRRKYTVESQKIIVLILRFSNNPYMLLYLVTKTTVIHICKYATFLIKVMQTYYQSSLDQFYIIYFFYSIKKLPIKVRSPLAIT